MYLERFADVDRSRKWNLCLISANIDYRFRQLCGTAINLFPRVANRRNNESRGSAIFTCWLPVFCNVKMNSIVWFGGCPTKLPDNSAVVCRNAAGGSEIGLTPRCS